MSTLLTRLALTFPPLFTAFGAFAFDFNETHVRNPRWPPHARYHNGQTMSMSLALCAACVYFTWWRMPSHVSHSNTQAAKEALIASYIFGIMYCGTGLSAILYPGSLGVDPEFYEESVGWFPQKWIFGLPLIVNSVAFWWEMRRLDTSQKGLKKGS